MEYRPVPPFRNPGATPRETPDSVARVVALAERGRGVRPGSLVAIGGKRTDYRDAAGSGLILRVSQTDQVTGETPRTWTCWYRVGGVARRLTLGRYPAMSLAEARAEAAKVIEAARRGEDVAAARKAARAEAQKARLVGETMTDLAERFLESHGAKLAPRTGREYERNLCKDVLPEIGRLGPRDVERAHIRALVEKIAKRAPTQANRTLATLSKLFAWAVSKDLLDTSPCVGIEKPAAEQIRERTYSNEELRAIFAAVLGTELEDLLPFIGYTAARDGEARSARWADIDLEEKTWTIRETKQGRAHVLPLSSGALRVLTRIERTSSRFVFPAATTTGHMDRPNDLVFKTVAIKAGLLRNEGTEEKPRYVGDNLRPHDLRRTVRTRLSSLGVSPDIAERVLGHAITGVRRNYDFYDYVNEKRAALEAWSAALDRILAGRERKGAQVAAFQRS